MKIPCMAGWLMAWASQTLIAQLSVSPQAIDFGERGHNETASDSILITNSGTVSLTISEVKASCGCLQAEPPSPSNLIPAGSSVEVRLTMSSFRAMGLVEKYLEIATVEEDVRPLRVPVSMRVFEGLQLNPQEFKFEGVVGQAPMTHSVDLTRAQVKKYLGPIATTGGVVMASTPGSVPSPSAHFSVKVSDIPSGKRLEVTLLPTHPEGRILANFYARVDGKQLQVPIAGEMFRGIKLMPTEFNFSRVAGDNPGSFVKESVLVSTDSRAFRLLSIASRFTQRPFDSCSIQIEDTSVKGGASATQHLLRATILAGDKPGLGSFSGRVVVKTDHPEKPEVTLSFFGFFAEPKKLTKG